MAKPKNSKDVIQKLYIDGYSEIISFYKGSKSCKDIDGNLIKETIDYINKNDLKLPRYAKTLIRSIDISKINEHIENEWNKNIDDLNILFYASPMGSIRHYNQLLTVSKNKSLVESMRNTLEEEELNIRSIEPTWLAVLAAEGSEASLRIYDKLRKQLNNPNLLNKYIGAKIIIEVKSNPVSKKKITNKELRTFHFLEDMIKDEYFPRHIVNEGVQVLIELCVSIEESKPKNLNELYRITHIATNKFNDLADKFFEFGSEIETVARENIIGDILFIAKSYGYKPDVESLVATRDW